ncbi:MAG: D-aminoacyl-tRNA deacylase [Planctomycetota bacterium]
MRAVLQRVSRASVEVKGDRVAETGAGLLVLVAIEKGDTPAEADWMARKIAELRIFEDDAWKMNRSVSDLGGEILLVSQFTLAADCHKGRRPSFDGAAAPEDAKPLIARVRSTLEEGGLTVREGAFGSYMKVALVNDGPVTIVLERRAEGQEDRR